MDVPISIFHDKMIKQALLCLFDWNMTCQSRKSTLQFNIQVVFSIIVTKKKGKNWQSMFGQSFFVF